mmetsp:Transcript_56629/g.115949  ORF Transcript_56629/g.115949 Transcript_56629/m.115949 type:complete len:316 (+) Transcript_56629:902-1849(+)
MADGGDVALLDGVGELVHLPLQVPQHLRPVLFEGIPDLVVLLDVLLHEDFDLGTVQPVPCKEGDERHIGNNDDRKERQLVVVRPPDQAPPLRERAVCVEVLEEHANGRAIDDAVEHDAIDEVALVDGDHGGEEAEAEGRAPPEAVVEVVVGRRGDGIHERRAEERRHQHDPPVPVEVGDGRVEQPQEPEPEHEGHEAQHRELPWLRNVVPDLRASLLREIGFGDVACDFLPVLTLVEGLDAANKLERFRVEFRVRLRCLELPLPNRHRVVVLQHDGVVDEVDAGVEVLEVGTVEAFHCERADVRAGGRLRPPPHV